jgi:uncharacterized protein (TIGR02118 family)
LGYNLNLMAQLVVLYKTPTDAGAFEHYYRERHIPLAWKVPKLRSYTISSGPVKAIGGDAPHLVATLTFETMQDLEAALSSVEGQAAAADLANFATGGATLLIFENENA